MQQQGELPAERLAEPPGMQQEGEHPAERPAEFFGTAFKLLSKPYLRYGDVREFTLSKTGTSKNHSHAAAGRDVKDTEMNWTTRKDTLRPDQKL